MEERYIVNVEGAIVKDGRYLLVVRGEGETHAAGTLSLVGGKVENADHTLYILEDTVRREILEEVGVEIDEVVYVQSSAFVTEEGAPVVDVIFLCRMTGGEARIVDAAEVAVIHWMSAAEVADDSQAPVWTKQFIAAAEQKRLILGW